MIAINYSLDEKVLKDIVKLTNSKNAFNGIFMTILCFYLIIDYKFTNIISFIFFIILIIIIIFISNAISKLISNLMINLTIKKNKYILGNYILKLNDQYIEIKGNYTNFQYSWDIITSATIKKGFLFVSIGSNYLFHNGIFIPLEKIEKKQELIDFIRNKVPNFKD